MKQETRRTRKVDQRNRPLLLRVLPTFSLSTKYHIICPLHSVCHRIACRTFGKIHPLLLHPVQVLHHSSSHHASFFPLSPILIINHMEADNIRHRTLIRKRRIHLCRKHMYSLAIQLHLRSRSSMPQPTPGLPMFTVFQIPVIIGLFRQRNLRYVESNVVVVSLTYLIYTTSYLWRHPPPSDAENASKTVTSRMSQLPQPS